MLLATAAACARAASRMEDEPESQSADSVTIAITNDNFYDARVHALYTGGNRYALGTVGSNGQRAAVTIRWEPKPIVFEILFIISGAVYVSHPVQAASGDTIEVRLPPNIEASGFFQRVPRSP
jgi:hypothetical protein